MIEKALISSAIFVFIIGVLIFRPVPIVKEKDALVDQGRVEKLYEAGINDIVFVLKDNSRRYYINRGLEQGLNLDTLRAKLIGKEVTIKYPSYWTPLDWNNEVKHLSKLELNEEVIFNELKPSSP